MQVQAKNKRFYFKIQDYTSGTTKKYPVIAMNLEEARNILYSTYFNGRTDDTYDILAIKEISKSYYSSIVRKGGFPVNRGVKAPLLEVDIRNAMANTNSNRAAAKYLNVGWKRYRRWAKSYRNSEGETLYDVQKNKAGTGIAKPWSRTPMSEILAGEHPKYNKRNLKNRLISEGYKAEECETCGFDSRRPSDNRVPLVLHWDDGDSTNHKLDNLSLMCLNCKFLYHEGSDSRYIQSQLKKGKTDDRDWNDELGDDIYEQLRNM